MVQAANDKQQAEQMLAKLLPVPEGLNHSGQFLADSDYFSEDNVETCNAAGIEPLIA